MAARAESIRQAADIMKAYYRGADVRVVYPIDPETFFVEHPTSAAGPGKPVMNQKRKKN